jgi:hypothetical protein
MDEEFILSTLKILGSLKPNDKLSVHKGFLVIKRNFLSKFFKKDSRYDVIVFLRNFIEDVFHFLDKIIFFEDFQIVLRLLLLELENVENGLKHLRKTYSSDRFITDCIDNFINLFNDVINRCNVILT